MKKILCLIAIIIAFGISPSSYAQKLMIGPRVGINIANQSWDSIASGISKGTRSGLIAGAQIDVWFSENVALSTGILLDQKGWNEVPDYPNAPLASSDFTLNYLEIPIFLKVGFGSGSVQPYVFAGPSIGYMFNGYGKQSETGFVYGISEFVNTFDFSIVGGAGIAFNLPSGTQIFVDAGYVYGLVNILNGQNYYDELGVPGISSPDVSTIKSRDIRISAGVLFPI